MASHQNVVTDAAMWRQGTKVQAKWFCMSDEDNQVVLAGNVSVLFRRFYLLFKSFYYLFNEVQALLFACFFAFFIFAIMLLLFI